MKRVIRESAFETNSSSNHAVFIKRKTDDEEISPINSVIKPYDKMLFLWGIKTVADAFHCNFIVDELKGEDYENELKEIKKDAQVFRDVIIEECLKFEEFDIAKTKEMMDYTYSQKSYCPTCEKYFNNGVLIECNCGMAPYKIAEFLGIKGYPFSREKPEQVRELAQKFFSDKNVYLLTRDWL